MQQNLYLEIPELLCFLFNQFTDCWFIQLSLIPNCILWQENRKKQKRIAYAVWGVYVRVHIHLRALRGFHLEEGMATHSRILAWRIPVDGRGWWATVHGVTKSLSQPND